MFIITFTTSSSTTLAQREQTIQMIDASRRREKVQLYRSGSVSSCPFSNTDLVHSFKLDPRFIT